MNDHEALELGNQGCMPPERRVRIEAVLDRRQPQALEASDFAGDEMVVSDARQGVSAPETERFVEEPGGGCGVASGQCRMRPRGQRLEPVGVIALGRHVKNVTGPAGDEDGGGGSHEASRLERPAEL